MLWLVSLNGHCVLTEVIVFVVAVAVVVVVVVVVAAVLAGMRAAGQHGATPRRQMPRRLLCRISQLWLTESLGRDINITLGRRGRCVAGEDAAVALEKRQQRVRELVGVAAEGCQPVEI